MDMMERAYLGVAKRSMNDTEIVINQWNLNVPSYWYREIPAIIEVLGTLLNVMIMSYFIKSKRYQTPLFTILTSLSLMDTCVCIGGLFHIFIFPTVITAEAGYLCNLVLLVAMIGIIGSEYHLMLFAGLRLYQVLSPLKARATVTVGLMMKYCGTLVVLSIAGGIVFALYWRAEPTYFDGKQITVCVFIGDIHFKDMACMAGLTILPCASIFLIHVVKYVAYIRSKGLVQAQHERKNPDARALIIVIALFYICLVPGWTYMVVQSARIDNYSFGRDSFYLVFMDVMFYNSALNPLVYVLAMKSIRDNVINLFCLEKHKAKIEIDR